MNLTTAIVITIDTIDYDIQITHGLASRRTGIRRSFYVQGMGFFFFFFMLFKLRAAKFSPSICCLLLCRALLIYLPNLSRSDRFYSALSFSFLFLLLLIVMSFCGLFVILLVACVLLCYFFFFFLFFSLDHNQHDQVMSLRFPDRFRGSFSARYGGRNSTELDV